MASCGSSLHSRVGAGFGPNPTRRLGPFTTLGSSENFCSMYSANLIPIFLLKTLIKTIQVLPSPFVNWCVHKRKDQLIRQKLCHVYLSAGLKGEPRRH